MRNSTSATPPLIDHDQAKRLQSAVRAVLPWISKRRPHDADDVAQEAVLALLVKISKGKSFEELAKSAKKISWRKLSLHFRKQTRRRKISGEHADLSLVAVEPVEPEEPKPDPMTVLDRLPDMYREAARLVWSDLESQESMSRRLGLTRHRIRQMLGEARAMIDSMPGKKDVA